MGVDIIGIYTRLVSLVVDPMSVQDTIVLSSALSQGNDVSSILEGIDRYQKRISVNNPTEVRCGVVQDKPLGRRVCGLIRERGRNLMNHLGNEMKKLKWNRTGYLRLLARNSRLFCDIKVHN